MDFGKYLIALVFTLVGIATLFIIALVTIGPIQSGTIALSKKIAPEAPIYNQVVTPTLARSSDIEIISDIEATQIAYVGEEVNLWPGYSIKGGYALDPDNYSVHIRTLSETHQAPLTNFRLIAPGSLVGVGRVETTTDSGTQYLYLVPYSFEDFMDALTRDADLDSQALQTISIYLQEGKTDLSEIVSDAPNPILSASADKSKK